VHPRVQFTREEENGSIAFLDLLLTRQDNGTISTTVYRKPSNTNITIKPQSCQHPSTTIANFKGELCRAHRICSTQEALNKEIEFLLNLFEDNGHKRSVLEELAKSYSPPTLEHTAKNSKKNKKGTNKQDDTPDNLFDVLPFKGVAIADEAEFRPYVCIPYLPGPTYHRLKRAYTKAGVNLVSKSGTKLKDLLCSANNTKHSPTKKPSVYQFQCQCSDKAIYVGQTSRSIVTRGKEHGRASLKGNWSHSGISAHKEHCKTAVDWEKPTVIVNKSNKNKKKLEFDLKVREALEIRRRGCGPGHGLNEDYGSYVKTTMWNPVFHRMDKD